MLSPDLGRCLAASRGEERQETVDSQNGNRRCNFGAIVFIYFLFYFYFLHVCHTVSTAEGGGKRRNFSAVQLSKGQKFGTELAS